MEFVFNMIGNIAGKGENAAYWDFILFPQYLKEKKKKKKNSHSGSSKVKMVWERQHYLKYSGNKSLASCFLLTFPMAFLGISSKRFKTVGT